MQRPRRSSLSSPLAPSTPSSARRSLSPSAGPSPGLKRIPSSHLLSRPSPASAALCTAPSAGASPAAVSSLAHSPSAGGGRARRLSLSSPSPLASSARRSHPIPISPTESPHASPSALHARHHPPHGQGQGETTLARALRHNDPSLIRDERARLAPSQAHAYGGRRREESSDGSGSGESYDVPIVDVSRAGTVRSSGWSSGGGTVLPPSSGAGGLVGGVRYSNGRRMSSLATYTGLPQPPQLVGIGGVGGGVVSAREEPALRYSLSGLGAAGGKREASPGPGAGAGGRRASISGGSGSGIVRVPTPGAGPTRPVAPLSLSKPGRAPSPSPGPGLAALHTRRASSPTGPRPGPGLLMPASLTTGTGSVSGSALSSTPGSGSAALRRAPSPARGRSGSLASGGAVPTGMVRAASPGPARLSSYSSYSSGGGGVRAPSPGRGLGSPPSAHGGGPRVVRGFDAPTSPVSPSHPASALAAGAKSGRAPSPARAPSFSSSAASYSRGRSGSLSSASRPSLGSSSLATSPPLPHPSHTGSGSASTYPPSSTPSSAAAGSGSHTTTRPRSRLANPLLDERLEIRASRDFKALDGYYERRAAAGRRDERERRERSEAEERLRRGYDRLSGSGGVAGAR
ncbi:hypothetical protein JCM10207_000883 [Rhodosporidiobolus poonsookiae]